MFFWQDEEWEEGDGEWEYEARVSYGHSGRLNTMCWEIGYPNHSLTIWLDPQSKTEAWDIWMIFQYLKQMIERSYY